ncbi:MAG: hypothetical protein U1E84_11685 [Rhodoferax sp.]
MLRKIRNLLFVALASVLGTYLVLQGMVARAQVEAQELKSIVTRTEEQLIGRTSYTTFLTAGKQSLAGQMKLLAATVTREENVTETVDREFLPGLRSSATVAIAYKTEYSFGYNLQPDQYDLRAVPSGIEIQVKKPVLVATPAVSNLKYTVLTEGVFVNSNAALLKLTADAVTGAKARGNAMAASPEIMALCEKKLVDFVYSFLAKQPGVKVVPRIAVVYI